MIEFEFERQEQKVNFVETVKVNKDVYCDVYSFDGDKNKDLGVIKIKAGGRTPLQKVLQGDRTIEGHIFGKGRLEITGLDGMKRSYEVDNGYQERFSVDVKIGELMQWYADTDLTAFEVCIPPYKDGRFENLTD
jgi:hypothetical protein